MTTSFKRVVVRKGGDVATALKEGEIRVMIGCRFADTLYVLCGTNFPEEDNLIEACGDVEAVLPAGLEVVGIIKQTKAAKDIGLADAFAATVTGSGSLEVFGTAAGTACSGIKVEEQDFSLIEVKVTERNDKVPKKRTLFFPSQDRVAVAGLRSEPRKALPASVTSLEAVEFVKPFEKKDEIPPQSTVYLYAPSILGEDFFDFCANAILADKTRQQGLDVTERIWVQSAELPFKVSVSQRTAELDFKDIKNEIRDALNITIKRSDVMAEKYQKEKKKDAVAPQSQGAKGGEEAGHGKTVAAVGTGQSNNLPFLIVLSILVLLLAGYVASGM